MIIRSLAILLVSILTTQAYASEVHFWVLGSFVKEGSAKVAAQALSGKLDGEVIIAKFSTDSGKRYRILTAHSDITTKQRLKELKIDAWALWLDLPSAPVMKTNPKPADTTQGPDHVNKDTYSQSQSTSNVRGPRAGESLQNFCLNRANPEQRTRFCRNEIYTVTASKQAQFQRLSDQEQSQYCATEANRNERKALCHD